ncbi:MAG: 50S ribosomal protein L13 [Candidatus Buchananbacteria bacterium]|nr:50S ribosomal protein L13 [Candidatus Buchananbacteria bacterium]
MKKNNMEKIERKTHKIDATGRPLGRLATEVAMILRGKNKVTFQPHIDGGDFVEIINPDKIKFTGKKLAQKEFITHSNYPGGLKRKKVRDVFATDPGEVLRRAVVGMLPKNKLRDLMIKRLIIK